MRKADGLIKDAISCGRRNLTNEMPQRDRWFGRADFNHEELNVKTEMEPGLTHCFQQA
jgi:hypothetical protein